jgi:hypothetical protein
LALAAYERVGTVTPFFLFLFLFTVLGGWTQGLSLASQVLYHLRHIPSSLLLWLFLRWGVALCPSQSGSWSSCLCSQHRWNDRSMPQYHRFYWWRWALQTFCPDCARAIILLMFASQVASCLGSDSIFAVDFVIQSHQCSSCWPGTHYTA